MALLREKPRGRAVVVPSCRCAVVPLMTFECQIDDVCCRLNLLIAIMGDSYEKVKEGERVEAIRERARIVHVGEAHR